MAVVKTSKTYFGGKPVTMRISVKGDGVFRAPLPEFSRTALGMDAVEAKTLDACEFAYKCQQQEYSRLLSSRSKVIRYIFNITDKTDSYCDPGGRSDIAFGVGKGVQFGVCNCWETIHLDADGVERRRSYDTDNQDPDEHNFTTHMEQPYPRAYRYSPFEGLLSNGNAHTMPWTKEREDWFLGLCLAMDSLVAKLRSLDEQPEQLLAIASTPGGFARLMSPAADK